MPSLRLSAVPLPWRRPAAYASAADSAAFRLDETLLVTASADRTAKGGLGESPEEIINLPKTCPIGLTHSAACPKPAPRD